MEIVCLVCYEQLQQDAKLCTTPCGHLFHTDCLVSVAPPGRTTVLCPSCRQPFDPVDTVRMFVESSVNNSLSVCEQPPPPAEPATPRKVQRNKQLTDRKDELHKRRRQLEQEIVEETHTGIIDKWQIENLQRKCCRINDESETNRCVKIPQLKAQLARMPPEAQLTATQAEQRSRIKRLKAAIGPHFSDDEVPHMMHSGQSVKSMKAEVIILKKYQLENRKLAAKAGHQVEVLQEELADVEANVSDLKQREAQLREALSEVQRQKLSVREPVMPSTSESTRIEIKSRNNNNNSNTPQRAVLQKAGSMGNRAGDGKVPQVKALDALQKEGGRRGSRLSRAYSAVN